jgi:hypothetical protein
MGRRVERGDGSMTSTHSIFGMSMAQMAKLFGAHASGPAAAIQQPQAKPDTTSGAKLVGAARNIASEALDAIYQLTAGSPASRPQASPGSALLSQLKSMLGGEEAIGEGQTAGASLGAYSFSFSQRITMASATSDGRSSRVQTYEINVEFNYAEGFMSVGGQGGQSAAFRSISAQISVSFGSESSWRSRSHGEHSHRQQLQCLAPPSGQQWSNNVMMASGRYESAALWTPTASASWSRAAEISVGYQSSSFRTGGA